MHYSRIDYIHTRGGNTFVYFGFKLHNVAVNVHFTRTFVMYCIASLNKNIKPLPPTCVTKTCKITKLHKQGASIGTYLKNKGSTK